MRTTALAFILSTIPAVAVAQANCMPRETAAARLFDRYGEVPHMMGMAADGQILQMFASDETGTWTAVVTSPRGVSCLVASGMAFELIEPQNPSTDC